MITTVAAPRINTNDNKVEVVAWHVSDGDLIEAGQEIADLETSKAVVTIQSEGQGFIRCLAKSGGVIKVGEPLYLLADSQDELQSFTVAPVAAASGAALQPTGAGHGLANSGKGSFSSTRFSAAALKLMAEKGWGPERFEGAGLVTARMLSPQSTPLGRRKAAPSVGTTHASSPALVPGLRADPVSLAKHAEIDNLTLGESGNINSMLTVQFPSEGIRRRLAQEDLFDGNIQPLILFETARLLRQWPQLTAFFAEDHIHFHDRVDLGVAFDLGKGLKVVTIPGTDRLMPREIFDRTIEIGLRYMENRLASDELVGSTFTITDLSGLDILIFHPLINGQQSAIMGIGADKYQAGYPMSFNLTFDHRVTNGRDVAMFLNELRGRLLSYALPAALSEPLPAGNAPWVGQDISLASKCCDACGIELDDYMERFGRDAYMVPYFRADGSLGGVCHRCFGGV